MKTEVDFSLELPLVAIRAAHSIIRELDHGPADKRIAHLEGQLIGALQWLLKALAARGEALHHNPKHFWNNHTLDWLVWPEDYPDSTLVEALAGNTYYESTQHAIEALYR